MAFKPNYNQQRAVRSRAKEQKKQEKLARKQDDAGKTGADLPEGELPEGEAPEGEQATADQPNASGDAENLTPGGPLGS